jgi:hypothetical protein
LTSGFRKRDLAKAFAETTARILGGDGRLRSSTMLALNRGTAMSHGLADDLTHLRPPAQWHLRPRDRPTPPARASPK